MLSDPCLVVLQVWKSIRAWSKEDEVLLQQRVVSDKVWFMYLTDGKWIKGVSGK